jgi:hypothetical protein
MIKSAEIRIRLFMMSPPGVFFGMLGRNTQAGKGHLENPD